MALFNSSPSTSQSQAEWTTDPLLSSQKKVPRFLRTQWDEKSAKPFGPWRSSEKMDPSTHLMADEEATELAPEVEAILPESQEDQPRFEGEESEFPSDSAPGMASLLTGMKQASATTYLLSTLNGNLWSTRLTKRNPVDIKC
jgi:hypothetical protein